jgi:hypothetical protein
LARRKFRLFDLLVGAGNPGLKAMRWKFDGVEFERHRHSFMGPHHGMTMDVFTLTRRGRRGWSLMVAKEYWWAGVFAVFFWTFIWGLYGAFIGVPIAIAALTFCGHYPRTQWIADLFGGPHSQASKPVS